MGLKKRITREHLKRKIGDQNIWEYYFPYPVEVGRSYKSVLREDSRPSTGFFLSRKGSIVYGDFATGERYDFVNFVMKLYNVKFNEALHIIAVDFGLEKGTPSKGELATIKPVKKLEPKKEKVLRVGVIKFKQYHLDWWKQYGITKDDLIANNIYAVNTLYINDYFIPTKEGELRFAYLFKDQHNKEYLKVYSPNDEEWRWVSSTPLTLPFGMDKLTCTQGRLIITKSVKDCLVLRKFFPEVIALQNESKDAITKGTVSALKKCYNEIILWFDQDKTGNFVAKWFKQNYGFNPVFTPLSSYKKHGVKDPSDFIKQYGIEVFEQYLKHINLL